MKKLVTLLLALMLILGCVAFAEDAPTYFINPKTVAYNYWAVARAGAERAGEELGVNVIYNAPDTSDSALQIAMISDMITSGEIDGIAISPNDGSAIASVIDDALDAGINTITWDSDATGSNRAWFVAAASQEGLGEAYAESCAKQLGGKGKVVLMVAGLGAENQVVQKDAAIAYLEKNYPEIEVVDIVASNDEAAISYANAQNIIAAYPDIDGIIGFAGNEIPAFAEYYSELIAAGKYNVGDIVVSGFGLPNTCMEYIKSGIVNETIAWDPGMLGYTSVYVLDEMHKGTDIASLTEVPGECALTIDGPCIYIGTITVNADNVDSFGF